MQLVAEYSQKIERINVFDPSPENPFVLGLPTGSSPEGIYKHLVRRYKNGDISFRNVVTFNMVSVVTSSHSSSPQPKNHKQKTRHAAL
jgi:6-phosphogluconolactonase/glucosamine-6-phosphate isomerase/deaminase